ncbi:hypothetical protein ACFY1P_20660 [Streptomyces sp. NPDC001407]|uniref:hypothetical protein n=1 Tax=Streptomyces sp. NPDC001407 TaxID=3364573 RepID=UPI0036BAB50F
MLEAHDNSGAGRQPMPWDDLKLTGQDGRRRSLANALREYYGGDDGSAVVAVDASLSKRRAYLAVRDKDDTVRPLYLWLAPAEEFVGGDSNDPEMGPYLMQKVIPVEESPVRWPRAVAEAADDLGTVTGPVGAVLPRGKGQEQGEGAPSVSW